MVMQNEALICVLSTNQKANMLVIGMLLSN